MTNQLLSSIEHKLLVVIALLICCLYFANLTNKAVEDYNNSVQRAEAFKAETDGTDEEKISIAVCYFNSPKPHEIILGFQILLAPLLLVCLLSRKPVGFIASTLLSSLMLFGFLSWLYRTYSAIKFNRSFSLEHTSLNDFLFYNSTNLEAISFLVYSILFVLQISILTRFLYSRFITEDFLS